MKLLERKEEKKMIIQVSGYSVLKDRDTGKEKGVVLHGFNLDRKCYNGEGYEPVYVRRGGYTNVGLFIPDKYRSMIAPDLIGKKIHVSFNLQGYIDEMELAK